MLCPELDFPVQETHAETLAKGHEAEEAKGWKVMTTCISTKPSLIQGSFGEQEGNGESLSLKGHTKYLH